MIESFAVIKSVGRFRSFSAPRGEQYDFYRFTILYGRNTKGKSTLTAILRSLKNNDPSIICGRKTFGATNPQEAHINIVDASGIKSAVRFQNSQWSSILGNLYIFDSKFVRDNVHLDGLVNEDHQKSLETVMLGERGKELQRKLEGAASACQANTVRKQEITREYNTHQRQNTGLEFDKFRKLEVDDSVQDKIVDKKHVIEKYTKYNDIKAKLNSLKNSLDNLPFEGYKESLSPTLEVRQDAIKDHIREHMKNQSDAVRFLYDGYKQLKDGKNSCVFCGQAITSLEATNLIENYSKLFSEEYRSLNQSIKDAKLYTVSFSITKLLAASLERLKDLGLELDLSELTQVIDQKCKELCTEIESKSQDLNYNIEQGHIQGICDAVANLSDYLIGKLGEYSEEFDPVKLENLRKEERGLLNIQIRSTEPWSKFCQEYLSLETAYKGLEGARKQALKEKNDYAVTICQQYETLINQNLESLSADFRLKDVRTREKIRSKEPLYCVEFFGNHKVKVSSNDPSEPCFENTLSESDKRLLAFAFFLAEVQNNPNKDELILVLDDPMSSFDEDRKLRTVQILKELQSEVSQMIVLTHETTFLRMLSEQVNGNRTFKIDYDMVNSTSLISVLDVNEEYLDPYFQNINSLHALDRANDSEVTPDKLRCMRDIIEYIQVRKYYQSLQSEVRDKKSVGTFTEKLKTDGIYTPETAERITNLYLNFWNHDDSTKVVRREDFSPGDLRTIASTFFDVLKLV